MPNSAPAGSSLTRTVPRSYTLHKSDFGFSDSDGNAFRAVVFTTLPSAGTLYYDSNGSLGGGRTEVVAGQTISAADILAGRLTYVAPAGVSGANYDHFTFQVQDDGGIAGGGVDLDATPNTLTFDLVASAATATAFGGLIDVGTMSATNGFKIQGDLGTAGGGDYAGFSVSSAGDVNGDGFADLIVGAWGNDSGGSNAGAAHVIFGKSGGFGSLIDLTGLSSADGFAIQGDAANENAGFSVSSAGDVNGDGFADLLVGAIVPSGNSIAGAAYVIFGKSGGFGGPIHLNALSAADGFEIRGEPNGDNTGRSLASAGDVNGDGFADIIVGAWRSGDTNAGAAYVIFGKASGFGSSIGLSTLSATAGFKIQGDPAGHFAGYSVSSAGDVNGDGFADILVATGNDSGGGINAGATYVIFGKSGGFGSVINLAGLSAADGFKIQGDVTHDYAGHSVSSAGDVNGDGFADILVGAYGNDSGGDYAGAAYVIFGKAGGFGSLIDLTGLSAADGFKIQGDLAGDRAGISVSSAGDVNGDGFADILLGARGNDSGAPYAGAAYVIFGKSGGFGSLIDLTGLAATDGFKIQGDSQGDQLGARSVSAAGDVNGDGFDDIIVGAHLNASGGPNAGAAYVIFGRANINTAPAIDLNGTDTGIDNTGSYTENASPAILAGGLIASDFDETNVASAAVQITGGFLATLDRLTINGLTSGTASGINFSYSASTGILSLTGYASLAAYQSVLRQVGFDSTSNDPGATRTIMWTVDDGAAGSGPAFTSLDVTEVSDSPSGADKVITLIEDSGAYVFTVADFGFSDVDGDNFTFFGVNSVPFPGTLLLDPDGAGPQPGAPVSSGQFIQAFQIANGQLTYIPAANGSGASYSNLSFQVFDDGSTANGGSNFDQSSNKITFNITPVNDAPIVDLNGAGAGTSTTLGYTENAPATAIAASATVTDIDTTNYNSGHLLVQMTNGLNAEDVLSIINQGNGAGQIGYVSGAILYQGAPIADLLPPPMSPFPVLDIAFRSGTIAPAAIQALVRAIGYANLSDNPTTSPDRTISFTLTDGDGTANGGADTGIATATIQVTAVDDPAVARSDAVATNEAAVLNGSVLGNNGSGADSDVDGGPAFSVTAVNGNAGAVGNQITLGSGALLTLNANGAFTYNPNHAFDATPAAGSGASNVTAPDSFTYTLTGGSTATVSVTINGIDSNDVLVGTAGADVLIGGIGADTLQAANGDDFLDGGSGGDNMFGGTGNDIYIVDNAADVVNELAGQGNDLVYTAVSYQLAGASEVEILSSISQDATTALELLGNAYHQVIYGNAGVNFLEGLGGGDVLIGLGGSDTYVIDSTTDYVAESLGGGDRDVVFTRMSYTLPANQEVEVLSTISQGATTAIDLEGNQLRNELYGNAGANHLDGAAGADLLVGFGGNDIYVVDNAGDVIYELAGQGTDILYAKSDYELNAVAEIEVISAFSQASTTALNLTGSQYGQTIYGNAGANTIDGGGGTDLMVGFGGNDTYIVDSADDYVAEAAGEGRDAVYAKVSYTLAANQEIEILSAQSQSSTSALNLTGNGFGNEIYGSAGANVLDGGAGGDYLVGMGGADTFAFTTTLGGGNVDTIADFTSGTDKIALDDAVFTAIGGLGGLNANAFFAGTGAHDADDRIIYDSATGNLFYDADGNGAGAQILFATLQSHPVIAASDFQVI
jgi:VCBS repeat-containing protein